MRGFVNALSCCRVPTPKVNVSEKPLSKASQKTAKSTPKRRNDQRILLLGTGESGKSTFLKQMKIIAGKKFKEAELMTFRDIIYDNVYKGVLFLLQARSSLKIPWAGSCNCEAATAADALENHFKTFQRTQRERARLRQLLWTQEEFLEIAPLLAKIWSDDSIRLAFDQRSRLITEDFSENTRFYLNRIDQIAKPNYVPTNEDIVWSRRPTNSIIEEEICVHGIPITFIDVGGQTKERSKWCHTFTDMTSVLFLVACSHYDEFYVDRVTEEYRNKLREAMDVFESLINHVSFRRVSIILFFNKTDILKEKLTAGLSSIRSSFPEFPAEGDERKLTDVQNFLVTLFSSLIDPNPDPTMPEEGEPMQRLSGIQKLFHSKSLSRRESGSNASSQGFERAPRRRTVYRHFTTAVDRRNIETVFNAMQDTILQSNLRRLMMS